LDAADVPADLPAGAAEADAAMPPAMRQALTELRLI
jgi:hypothetical protein